MLLCWLWDVCEDEPITERQIKLGKFLSFGFILYFYKLVNSQNLTIDNKLQPWKITIVVNFLKKAFLV